MMRAEEWRDLADDELAKRLVDLKEELFSLRFQNVTGQLENPLRLREVRRDIARVRTVQREREIAAEHETARGAG